MREASLWFLREVNGGLWDVADKELGDLVIRRYMDDPDYLGFTAWTVWELYVSTTRVDIL